ncbi:DUF2947 family protein [Thalassotalea crassostreae]|uniref:DUF2947 family protein n=1 Tax=Thalassotalea crassostreae TaxID=1763536 RepID=UPI0008387CCC|nr:DUF2947 family protein [Thalassotalea crassostreae]
MSYIAIDDLKHGWAFRFKALPISELDLKAIKPMSTDRSTGLWSQFISRQVDHPDFFKKGDWPFDENNWTETGEWQTRWESDDDSLPEEIMQAIDWQDNTTVYYCNSRKQVIECNWGAFKRCWKNFLMMDDGPILIGKKRPEAIQFLQSGQFKIGRKS